VLKQAVGQEPTIAEGGETDKTGARSREGGGAGDWSLGEVATLL